MKRPTSTASAPDPAAAQRAATERFIRDHCQAPPPTAAVVQLTRIADALERLAAVTEHRHGIEHIRGRRRR